MKRSTILLGVCTASLVALAACSNSSSDSGDLSSGSSNSGNSKGTSGSSSDPNATGSSATGAGNGTGTSATGAAALDTRVTDYGEALRSASLKLTGDLPTLDEIKSISSAADDTAKKAALGAAIDKWMADPRFAATQVAWWQNTFKTGNDPAAKAVAGMPSFDTAATFAASVVVNDQPYTDILTASTGTCPTFTAATGTFTPANCANKAATSGVLTDPGLMAQYFSNMSFRRVRFVQETFACAKMPAEVQSPGTPMGAGTYTSPWDFNSITGGTGAKIDFHDTSAVICANCHTTMNHVAPAFADFDAKGVFQGTIQVQTPVTPPVTTVMTDWLPAGQGLAWRNNVPITDLPSLGQAMAKDTTVQACAVTRVWNWALSRGDVVNDGATVPATVIADQVAAFTASGFKMKALIKAVFTSDDFAKF